MAKSGTGKRNTTVFAQWPSAVLENFYECASNDPEAFELWAYSDRLSYQAGENIRFHVNTQAGTFDLVIYRDGAVRRDVHVSGGNKGRFSETPQDCSVTGCGWPVLLEVSVADDWPSGGYIAEFTARQGEATQIYRHIFVIRPRPKRRADILFITSTSTWLAYNDWGGSNYYDGITGLARNHFSPIISTERPWSRGFAWLPVGAPRIPLREPPAPGAAPRYPHMEWAYANGYSKKYASGGWASYDRHFLRWAETQGFGVDVITQHDLHFGRIALRDYKCVVMVGHDEYWSWAMRDAIDDYVEAGGHVARFAGNFLWQIRLENEGLRQVCYKYRARTEDPLRDTADRHLMTEFWESQNINRPGTLTFGLTGSRGVYTGWGLACPRASGGFTVYRPEHWSLKDTDLYYGDVFGSRSKVFGYEVDGLDYIIRDGLPYPTFSDRAQPSTEIIAMGLATTIEEDHGNEGPPFFVGFDDGRYLAKSLYGDDSPRSLDKVRRGSGMMIHFQRGKGEVFHAGTCEWVAGLIDRDHAVETITRNVLGRFLSK